MAALDNLVRREANLQAFNDCFHLLGLVLLGAIVVVFLARPTRAGAAAGAH